MPKSESSREKRSVRRPEKGFTPDTKGGESVFHVRKVDTDREMQRKPVPKSWPILASHRREIAKKI